MVWAIRTLDADWLDHNFRGNFLLTIHQGLGNNQTLKVSVDEEGAGDDFSSAFAPIRKFEGLSCLSNSWDQFTIDTCFDPVAQELVFKVEIPNNSYLGIGFGPTMTDTDMIVWEVYNGIGSVRDLYSTS